VSARPTYWAVQENSASAPVAGPEVTLLSMVSTASGGIETPAPLPRHEVCPLSTTQPAWVLEPLTNRLKNRSALPPGYAVSRTANDLTVRVAFGDSVSTGPADPLATESPVGAPNTSVAPLPSVLICPLKAIAPAEPSLP
jgi:hypothetical protein